MPDSHNGGGQVGIAGALGKSSPVFHALSNSEQVICRNEATIANLLADIIELPLQLLSVGEINDLAIPLDFLFQFTLLAHDRGGDLLNQFVIAYRFQALKQVEGLIAESRVGCPEASAPLLCQLADFPVEISPLLTAIRAVHPAAMAGCQLNGFTTDRATRLRLAIVTRLVVDDWGRAESLFTHLCSPDSFLKRQVSSKQSADSKSCYGLRIRIVGLCHPAQLLLLLSRQSNGQSNEL